MVWMGSSTPGNSLKGRGDDSWARDHSSICIVLGSSMPGNSPKGRGNASWAAESSSMPGRSLKEGRDEGPW